MRNLAKRVEELRTDNENTLIERSSVYFLLFGPGRKYIYDGYCSIGDFYLRY